jgi:glycosyltransferase involved in cell wall biosynthesis
MYESFPFVTIILPIRNESNFIARSLTAVQLQDYPSDRIEILVADGMSTDSTCEIVRQKMTSDPRIQFIENPGKIVPPGINRALKIAKGEIIIRVDGHTIIDQDYVRQCVTLLEKTGAQNVGGKMVGKGESLVGQSIVLATSSPFGVGGSRFHYTDEEEWVDSVYMGAWPRSVFANIGLFDEELVRDQDDEFNYRLREMGGKILVSPKIKSAYTVRSSFRKLWEQYFQYGFWKVRVLQKHPRQMSARQFVPPAFAFVLIASAILAVLYPFFRWLLVAVVGLYLCVNLLATVFTGFRNGWNILLPRTFAVLHLSYGLGFLIGLVNFACRWRDKVGKVPKKAFVKVD